MTDMPERSYDVRLNDLAREAHKNAVDNGFWDKKKDQQLGTLLMLVTSELVEILEEDRRGSLDYVSEKIPQITRFEEEMADVIIRVMDIVGAYKLNIEMAVKLKMFFNKQREFRHGKRY